MTRGLAVLSVVALLVGVVGCSERAAPVQETAELNQARASQALKGVLDRFTTAILKEFPDLATSLAVSEDVARASTRIDWSTCRRKVSPAGRSS